MAIAHAIRRGLAEAIRRHWRTWEVEDGDRAAADALAASPAPPPPAAPSPAAIDLITRDRYHRE